MSPTRIPVAEGLHLEHIGRLLGVRVRLGGSAELREEYEMGHCVGETIVELWGSAGVEAGV